MGHACIGIAAADRGDALTQNGLSLERIPPQGNGHMGMIEYLRDQPVAIDPRNGGKAKGRDTVVARLEKQAVKLGFVTWKHEVQDLPGSVAQDLIPTCM